jgi:hypothetical protein
VSDAASDPSCDEPSCGARVARGHGREWSVRYDREVQVARIDYVAIAARLRDAAERGLLGDHLDTVAALYVLDCSHRIGTSTIVFTREFGPLRRHGYSDPDHMHGYHLSLSCFERAERDTWVRAFFEANVPLLWACWWWTAGGREHQVSHWRLFCDEQWKAISVRNTAEVLRAGWKPASELGLAVHPS